MRPAYISKYNSRRERKVIILIITKKLKAYENVCKSHDYCHLEMAKKDKNILKYNHDKNIKI